MMVKGRALRRQNKNRRLFPGVFLPGTFFKVSFFLVLIGLLFAVPVEEGDSQARRLLSAQEKSDPPVKHSWISGKYFISRKQKVVGATVKLSQGNNKSIYLTSTDEEGTWRLNNIPEGNYRVEIFKEGFNYIEKKSVEVRFPFKTIVELQALPSMKAVGDILRWGGQTNRMSSQQPGSRGSNSCNFRGKVSAKDGTPILDAEIILKELNREANPLKAFSGSDGSFVLEKVRAGFYKLFVLTPGYLPLRFIAIIQEDTYLEATMLLQPLNYQATPSELLPSEEPIPPR
jgi:hypothetical protein